MELNYYVFFLAWIDYNLVSFLAGCGRVSDWLRRFFSQFSGLPFVRCLYFFENVYVFICSKFSFKFLRHVHFSTSACVKSILNLSQKLPPQVFQTTITSRNIPLLQCLVKFTHCIQKSNKFSFLNVKKYSIAFFIICVSKV